MGMTQPVLGIDVGERKLHAVAWDGEQLSLASHVTGPRTEPWDEPVSRILDAWVLEVRPGLVCVDAPCAPGRRPDGRRGRLCETECVRIVQGKSGRSVRFGIAQTPHVASTAWREGLAGWVRTGLSVYGRLAELGYPLASSLAGVNETKASVEVYPDASFWLWALATKPGTGRSTADGAPLTRKRHGSRAAQARDRLALLPGPLADGLRRMFCEERVPPSRQIDFVDAAACAVTGWLALGGEGLWVEGRPGEGGILLPG